MFTIPNSPFKAKITAKSYSLIFPGRGKAASANNTVYLLQTRSVPRSHCFQCRQLDAQVADLRQINLDPRGRRRRLLFLLGELSCNQNALACSDHWFWLLDQMIHITR